MFSFTHLSVKLGEWSVTTVHASTGGEGTFRRRGHGLTFGSVAAPRHLPAQSAAVLGGRAWRNGRNEIQTKDEPTVSPAVHGALLLTYPQATAGAHGAARLSPVLVDGGDADGAAKARTAVLNTDVLV